MSRFLDVFAARVRPGRTETLNPLLEAAHFRAARAYEPKRLSADVLVVRSGQQPHGIVPDTTLGWEKHLKGNVTHRVVPGAHLGMLDEPRVAILAAHIREFLKGSSSQQ